MTTLPFHNTLAPIKTIKTTQAQIEKKTKEHFWGKLAKIGYFLQNLRKNKQR